MSRAFYRWPVLQEPVARSLRSGDGRRSCILGIVLLAVAACHALAQSDDCSESADFARYALKLRESALLAIEPRILVPTTARTLGTRGIYQWKQDIITTIFWCGESASANNPVSNRSSCWDLNWATNYGGFDNPEPSARLREGQEYRPAAFIPRQNPFYIALPYNDVLSGRTKPQSRLCIPWFLSAQASEGQSVCRDRWVAIRNRRNARIAYAQWSDCGPFRDDHWQYVFGDEKPRPNFNGGAGLDVSPSVRDYLGLANIDVTDWRFVETREVPPGPWRKYGENNHFVHQARQTSSATAQNLPARRRDREMAIAEVMPRVTVR